MTTLQLLIVSVRDAADEAAAIRSSKRLSRLLNNEDDLVEGGDDGYKLWPINADRGDYRHVLDGALLKTVLSAPPGSGRIVSAYLWVLLGRGDVA